MVNSLGNSAGNLQTQCYGLNADMMIGVVQRWQNLTISDESNPEEKRSIANTLLTQDFNAELVCLSSGRRIEKSFDKEEFLNEVVEKIYGNILKNEDSVRDLTPGSEPNTIVFNQSCDQQRRGSGLEEGQEGWYHIEGKGVYTLRVEDGDYKICHYAKEYTKELIEGDRA